MWSRSYHNFPSRYKILKLPIGLSAEIIERAIERTKEDLALLRDQMEAAQKFSGVAYLMALNDTIRKGDVLRSAVAEYNAAVVSERAPL